jgi:integrase
MSGMPVAYQLPLLVPLPFIFIDQLKEVLGQEIGFIENIYRAKKPKRIPVVFTRDEIRAVMKHLKEEKWTMANLIYGSGLRLMECLRLRVKDVDFSYNQILVRDGKGHQDRITMLPETIKHPLKKHLGRIIIVMPL